MLEVDLASNTDASPVIPAYIQQKYIRTIALQVLKQIEEAEKKERKTLKTLKRRKMEKNTMAMKEKKGMRSTNSEDRQETPPKVGGAGGQEEEHSDFTTDEYVVLNKVQFQIYQST